MFSSPEKTSNSPFYRKGFSAQQALKKSIKKNRKNMPNAGEGSPETPSPSPDQGLKYELEEDLRTFEEKYKIINEDTILGEGCSSVVKACVLKDPNFKPENQN